MKEEITFLILILLFVVFLLYQNKISFGTLAQQQQSILEAHIGTNK